MPGSRQLDLLTDWTPPEAVVRFDPIAVRAATIEGRISKAISAVLKGKNREDVARQMSSYLGSQVSKAMIDAYASEARDDHPISLPRLMALLEITRDRRLLQVLAEEFGWAVVEDRHLGLIEAAELHKKRDEIDTMLIAARRRARR